MLGWNQFRDGPHPPGKNEDRHLGRPNCHQATKETGAIRQNELVNLTLLLLKEKQSPGDQLRFTWGGRSPAELQWTTLPDVEVVGRNIVETVELC